MKILYSPHEQWTINSPVPVASGQIKKIDGNSLTAIWRRMFDFQSLFVENLF